MMDRKMICWTLPIVLLASCATTRMDENQKFMRAMSKDVPFRMEQLKEMKDGSYSFENFDSSFRPDYVIEPSGQLTVVNTTFDKAVPELAEKYIYRNLFFNVRQHRIVCVDRFLVDGKRMGYVYPMQMESKKWPTKGSYHWDVTDRRNMQQVAPSLEYFKKQSLKAIFSLEEKK